MFEFVAGFGGVVAADGVAGDEVEEGEEVLGSGRVGRGGEAEVKFGVRLLGEDEIPVWDGFGGEGISGPLLDCLPGRFVRRFE